MKNKRILFLSAFAIIGFAACKRDNSGAGNTVGLDASKVADIKKGEPVVFTASKTTGSSVDWKVTSGNNANVQINPAGNSASVLFDHAGSFTIQATSPSGSASRTVTVNDSVYNGGGGSVTYTVVPLTGDQIQLNPVRADSGSNSGIILVATTVKNYDCLNHYLLSQLSVSGSDYSIGFSGVNVPDGSACMSGQAKASGLISLYPISEGSHAISVTLNGTTYSGTIVKSGSAYTITWPYTSGVTFTSLTL